jgi:GTP-binding protein
MPRLPQIVIVGRPNVGKSTLFNRICGRRRALVGNEPGMTRDRLYAAAEWRGKRFEVVDTGGIVPGEKELVASEVLRQARYAIEQAAHVVLVVDARQGIIPLDEELAHFLRLSGKPLALAVNKIDHPQQAPLAAEFHRLGIPHLFPLSAEHGLGVDDLLDHLTAGFPLAKPSPASEEEEGEAGALIKVAIIGHPNVGKSTLLNALLNQERAIVAPLPGTTRDAVDAELQRDGQRFLFIDTAGIRRKGKTRLLAEKLSVIQARQHLERSDVTLLMLDALEGVSALDTHIGGYAHESQRSVILVVNKWDAVPKGPRATQEFTEIVRRRLKYLDYAPLVFISALRRQRLGRLMDIIVDVAAARRRRIPTAEMNRFLGQLDLENLPGPRGPHGQPLKLYYLTQTGVAPPTFVVFASRGGKLHFSVERYLENRLRERFGFPGTPIVIRARPSR